jgi:hypothetical protein
MSPDTSPPTGPHAVGGGGGGGGGGGEGAPAVKGAGKPPQGSDSYGTYMQERGAGRGGGGFDYWGVGGKKKD